MSIQDKSIYFEYFLNKSIEKCCNEGINFINNDFSILKSQKLLFLLVSASIEIDKSGPLLKNVFNNFVAMPYGPVEIDIYNSTKEEKLQFFTITSSGLIEKSKPIFDKLDNSILILIDNAIDFLISKNDKIFTLKANVLVEITHLYKSWRFNYRKARDNNSFKEIIQPELILSENKYYNLNQFELI